MALEGLIGAAVLVVGVAIAGKVIFDELSDREERRQNQMRDEYDSYCHERKSRYNEIVNSYQRSYENTRNSYYRDYAEERRIRIEELKETNRPYLESIRDNINEQRELKKKDLEQLQKILEEWRNIKDKSSNTMLRMKSMKKSILVIEEACYKLQSYFCYLDRYENNMNYHFDYDGSIPEPFSMTLPKFYPYPGKIFELGKNEFVFDSKTNTYTYEIPDEKNLKLYLDKNEIEIFKNFEYDKIQVMVCYNKNNGKLANNVSIRRAAIKISLDGTQGIYASVENISKERITLSYEGIRLSLKRSDLVNPSRTLPKGAYITVFLKDYNFALSGSIYVSEKLQDSLSLASFQDIGMVLTDQQYNDLYKKLSDNKWLEFDDEWRIGPADINEYPIEHVKIQMGDYYGYLAKFKKTSENSDNMILEYKRLLDREEFFNFTDVFAAADVTIECYRHSAAYNLTELSKECAFLYEYLVGEFTSQKKMLVQSPMMLYFEKWLELTQRLIEVLKYKNRISIEIDSWEQHRNVIYLYVNIDKKLKKFLKQSRTSKFPQFYVNLNGDKNYYKCRVEILEDTNEIQIVVKNLKYDLKISEDTDEIQIIVKDLKTNNEIIIENEFIIDLVLLSNVYAEKSQVAAFSEFREGHISSLTLKEILLQMSLLEYNDTSIRIEHLYNSSIANNPQQYKAINRAFSVEDFFMIQGPPGTGKTTVIKELIMQQIHWKPDSRILIVSQANVAVDNVLRGIQKLCRTEVCISENQIIRCGTDDKIAEDIRDFSFSGRMEKYKQSLKNSNAKNPSLRQEWINFIESDNEDIVGNCLLRGYQIIGATCVGFSNRNVGLSGLDFDLVIIDEAGKALPGELLIPINHAKKLVLIGDHKQLPPVINPELYDSGSVETGDVIEENEHLDFFNKSFFERLWNDCPDENKCILNTQFRMPPVISGLVNLFYDGLLCDGEICSAKTPIAFDSHLVFIDMKDVKEYKEEQQPNSGPYNIKEQDVVIELVNKLRTVYSDDKRIVIITPYKNQKKRLVRRMLDEKIVVNTIDAFQGDEEDIVIYCMTRSCKPTEYFSDSARLNVAFSRARNLLIIIGSTKYLKSYGKEHILDSVYNYIKKNGRIIPYCELNSNECSVMNSKIYSSSAIENSSDNNVTDLTFDDVFKHKEETNITPESKCVSCGKILEYEENKICLECINKVENCVCSCCKKIFEFPLYSKYVEHINPPAYCNNCVSISSCDACNKEFKIPNNMLTKLREKQRKVLCEECRKEIVASCSQCRRNFKIKQGVYNERIKNNQKCLCEECKSSVNIICDCCGKTQRVHSYRLKALQNNNKKYYCDECKEEILVACENCKRAFYQIKWMYNKLQNDNKQCYCEECRENITIECDRCYESFNMVKWMYDDLRKRGKGCLCQDCRNNIKRRW